MPDLFSNKKYHSSTNNYGNMQAWRSWRGGGGEEGGEGGWKVGANSLGPGIS